VTTTAADAPVVASRRMLRPGTNLFTFVMAMSMAVTALGIDTVLPAFPEIREAMGLADGSNEVAGLVSFYLLGSSIGLLPAGLLADRFGRRSVMFGGLALYIAGAVASVFAPSLTVMFVGRFVWGLGSAGPRVGVMAMMRDSYSGDQMAKQMSFMMAVFILVPAFAPSLGTALLLIGPWQLIFWVCAAFAMAMAFTTARVPESLSDEHRVPLTAGGVYQSWRAVLVEPGTLGYLVALTALFGVFISYIASSEIILDEVFGLGEWFPLFFGAIALMMGAGMFVNGKVVERTGVDRMSGRVYALALTAVTVLLVIALVTDGRPDFWLFVPVIAVVMFAFQMLIPNLNSAGMQPLAHVAGTAAAILGMVSGALGSLIGLLIDRQFDGTITPLAVAMVIGTLVSAGGWWWAVSAASRGRLRPR
jgi:DHA1 family bicyclomycin/chloramphenicol resistance-like MFS transporter